MTSVAQTTAHPTPHSLGDLSSVMALVMTVAVSLAGAAFTYGSTVKSNEATAKQVEVLTSKVDELAKQVQALTVQVAVIAAQNERVKHETDGR